MKKIVVMLAAIVLVIGCSKKLSPSASNTSSSSNEKVVISTPQGEVNKEALAGKTNSLETKPTAVNTNTDAASTASKTTKEPGQLSPEQQGQATYSAKCGKCHGLKVTTDYTVNRWITVMQVMAGPSYANLSDVEKENVLAYVKLNAKKG